MKKRISSTVTALACVLLAVSSVQGAPKGGTDKATSEKGGKAIATLQPTQGNKARGVVMFTREKNGIRVVGVVDGLEPGAHGFHVHENGDCSAPDAESAGAHFNPTDSPHGGPADQKHHTGDFGNIEANVYGNAYYEQVNRDISLSGANSIIGRAVIVHANPDDLKTQPAGGAGARLACGVIKIDDK